MKCARCHAQLDASARFCGACGQPVEEAAQPLDLLSIPSPYDQMIGREIAGRWRLLAKLGEGGMGAVFRAEQISLKRTVALKLLKPELSSERELVRRFNAEAELAARLNHPNTVTLHDFGQDTDGTLFIAMEYIEGRSLRDELTRGPLSPARALAIAEQVSASLTDAHAVGIVHRDLKPDNVMLRDHGKKKDVVTVLDFGIAKLRDEHGHVTGMPVTQAGALLGTPQYMAPEQISGDSVDGRTDVYALGAMLYEMVTGRLPFEAPTLMEILTMHLTRMPVPPSQRRPDLAIPEALDRLIMAALDKTPEGRPQSMDSFGEMIAECQRTLGVAGFATPVPTGSGHGMPPGMDPITPSPAHATGPAGYASTGPVSSTGPAGHASHAAGASPAMGLGGTAAAANTPPQAVLPHPRRRSGVGLWIGLGAVILASGGIAAFVMLSSGDVPDSSLADTDQPVTPSFEVSPKRDIFADDTTPDDRTDVDRTDDDRTGDDDAIKSDFDVAPSRDIFGDQRGGKVARASTRYTHPTHGYAIDLPPGFVQVPSDEPAVERFLGEYQDSPAAIVAVHIEVNPRDLDRDTLHQVVDMLALSGGLSISDKSYRRIQGGRYLTGIVDDEANGLRMQFAMLPCGDAGVIMMIGTERSAFGKTRRLRREFFKSGITLP